MENGVTQGASWHIYMNVGAIIFLGIAILLFIYYETRVLLIRDYKGKYDYVNANEIRFFWYSVLMLIAAAALFTNSYAIRIFPVTGTVRTFVLILYTAGFLVIAYFILSSIVRVLYPKIVERRLDRIRNKPRTSPAGNKMRKLSEAEEDVHLDASQIAEEESAIHSVDYDVWIDEKTGYKTIEKYMNYQRTEKCSECGFYTMKIFNEEVAKEPTVNEPGLLLKHYRCSYCHHREIHEVVIAKLSSNVAAS